MHLQLAEFRQIGRARDLGRAAAALWGRRRAARRGTSRRRTCALTMSRRTRKVEFRRRARASRRRTSRRSSARSSWWWASRWRAPGRPVWKSNFSSARSKEPNSPVAFHTGKDGPRGTPRGGGPLGGAPRGAPGGGPAWERQRHETFIFYVHLSRRVSTARRRSSWRRAAALAAWPSRRRSSPV